jgi:quercetin dioxygenase-like cupin family protein
MSMMKPVAAFAALMLAAGAVAADFATVRPDQINWRPVPNSHGVLSALISGDPGKPGLYVIRVRFPPHVMDRPHTHSQDRHVTVIEGAWVAGTGPRFDPGAATPMPAGSYMFHPAGGIHWDGSNSDAAAIVQIIGMGPVTSQDIDPALASWVKLDK